MKRIIPATILLLSIVLLYFISSIYTNKVCNKTVKDIKKCVTLYEENNNAKVQAEKIKRFWSEKEKILSVFVNHELIDKVELKIASIELYSNFADNYMFYNACVDAEILLHQIIEDTKLSAHSIF